MQIKATLLAALLFASCDGKNETKNPPPFEVIGELIKSGAMGYRIKCTGHFTIDKLRPVVEKKVSEYMAETKQGPKDVFFIFTCWDEDTERPAKPYVAEVRVQDGFIQYFYKEDSSEKLGDVAVKELLAHLP